MIGASAERLSSRELAVWVRFLQAHQAIMRELERDLARYGLTLSDYDVLVQLARAPEHGLRPVELARAVLLTRSGITRLTQGLVRAGLVEKVDCDEDRRGSYLRLTASGRALLRRAGRTHLGGVRDLFARRFGDGELEAFGELLERLPRR